MARSPFILSETNPNDTTGGGGCICSPDKVTDCTGPYIIVPGNDMDPAVSPHVVVGLPCAARLGDIARTPALNLAVAEAVTDVAPDDVLEIDEPVEIDDDDDVPEV